MSDLNVIGFNGFGELIFQTVQALYLGFVPFDAQLQVLNKLRLVVDRIRQILNRPLLFVFPHPLHGDQSAKGQRKENEQILKERFHLISVGIR